VAHPCHRQCEGGRRKELVVEEPTAQGRAGQGSMRALRARPNPLSGGSHGLGGGGEVPFIEGMEGSV
jgi:hypothetical protein